MLNREPVGVAKVNDSTASVWTTSIVVLTFRRSNSILDNPCLTIDFSLFFFLEIWVDLVLLFVLESAHSRFWFTPTFYCVTQAAVLGWVTDSILCFMDYYPQKHCYLM